MFWSADVLTCRIYKPKYMDDDGAASAKGSPKKVKKDQKEDVDASLSTIAKEAKEKEAKASGRTRARSIWGRSKKSLGTT